MFVGAAFGQVVIEDQKIIPNNGEEFEFFGDAVALDNGIAAIAVPSDDVNGIQSGSVYLYGGPNLSQRFKLLPADGAAYDFFGDSVAVGQGVVVVGAKGDDDFGSDSGSAYLFDSITGEQIFKLNAKDAFGGDGFGRSVDIDQGIIVIGASQDDDNGFQSGSVYVFSVLDGQQTIKLTADDGENLDLFGWSVAIDNGIIVVGAHGDDDHGTRSGSVYIFDALSGVQLHKIVPADLLENQEFGTVVAIDNGIVAVGSYGVDPEIDSGLVYVFDAITGEQISKILPDDETEDTHFGLSVSVSDGVVGVGARLGTQEGLSSGTAGIYDAFSGGLISKLVQSDAQDIDWFGHSIAMDCGRILVSAVFDDDIGFNSGSVYVFSAPTTACVVDLTGDGILDFFDISAFLTAFSAGDPVADFTGDGSFDFFDISAFLTAFSAGCP